jgi:hypothetical protein
MIIVMRKEVAATDIQRMFEKSSCQYQILLDPPKSPDKLGDFDSDSPLFKGG